MRQHPLFSLDVRSPLLEAAFLPWLKANLLGTGHETFAPKPLPFLLGSSFSLQDPGSVIGTRPTHPPTKHSSWTCLRRGSTSEPRAQSPLAWAQSPLALSRQLPPVDFVWQPPFTPPQNVHSAPSNSRSFANNSVTGQPPAQRSPLAWYPPSSHGGFAPPSSPPQSPSNKTGRAKSVHL